MPWPRRHGGARKGRAVAAAVAALLLLAACSTQGEAAPAPSSIGPTMASPSACQVRYVVREQPSGFTADVSVTNLGTAIGSWRVDFELGSAEQKLAYGWGGAWLQTGTRMTASVTNGGLPGRANAVLGFDGTGPIQPAPKSFSVNGVACVLSVDSDTAVPTTGDREAPALHVSGNRIVDGSGTPVDLVGVNRSGGEFMCVQKGGFWDGPVDDESLDAMQSWDVHAVRVPLNEDCWLGGGAGKPGYNGAVYRNAVAVLVARLETHGLTPILDLHWTDGDWTGQESQCHGGLATCQKPVPDAHAVDFWRSVALTFKSDQAVAFDLFNEPYQGDIGVVSKSQSWSCWLDGGSECGEIGYDVAGMQQMLDAVRAAGARNVVLVSGSSWARDLTGWLAHKPRDPTGNLVAAWHWYDDGSCTNEDCWQRDIAPIAAQVPVLATEIGEKDCASTSVDPLMIWLDQHHIGYLAWSWNTGDCGGGPSLIKNYSGAPTAFGEGIMEHLRSRSNAPTG